MTLKELNFFYKLSDNPQVTQVAQELGISQSAISIAIKSLENKLNEKLFDRVGKKLVLNERGRFFKDTTYPHYLAIIDAQTIFQKNKLAGHMRIAASKTISNYIMPDIYYDFLSLYSEVKFDIETINSTKILAKILDSKLDVGLIETDYTHINILREKLYDDELIIVTSDKNHPKESYIDTIDKKWILREVGSGTREVFISKLGKHANNLNIFMELHGFEEIKKIIIDNKDCVTAISKAAVKNELKNKQLFEIKLKNFEFKREFYLIYHKDKQKNLLFQTFVEYLKDKLN